MSDDDMQSFASMIDDEYDDAGVEGLYQEAGGNTPNFDCPMDAVLEVLSVQEGLSENPQTDVRHYMSAEFKILDIRDQKEPLEEGAVTKLREGMRVSDFNRLPDRNYSLDKASFPEKKGLTNMYNLFSAILGIREKDMDEDFEKECLEAGGANIKGYPVGVVVTPDEYETDDGESGVAYRPDYYPVDQTGDGFKRVERVPPSEL